MKESTEKVISLKGLKDPEALADHIEEVAIKMSELKWEFVTSAADDLMENLTLFFERDI